MEERVITIDIKAEIAKINIDVCDANIILGVNEIPRIELIIPPTQKDFSNVIGGEAFHPTLSDLSELYKLLSHDAETNSETGSVEIKIHTTSTLKNKEEGTETIKLKDWILSGVGLSGAGAYSAPHLSVILHHPAYWLTKVGSIYETPRVDTSNKVSAEISRVNENKFLNIVDKVYSYYRNGTNLFFKPPENSGDIAAVYRSKLGVGDFNPSKYIEDKSGIIFSRCFEDQIILPRIKAAMSKLAIPMSDGTSTWDMLVRASGTLLLNIVQDESNNFLTETNKGLVLEPIKPWKTDKSSNVIKLTEDRCFMTDIPGADLFKISGVMTRILTHTGTVYTWADTVNNKIGDESNICDIMYCPEGFPPEKSDGRIMKTSAPEVLTQIFAENSDYGDAISLSKLDGAQTVLTHFNNALNKYCRAVYEITYKSLNTAKAQMALGFRDSNNKLILPGNTCRFVSSNEKEEVDIYYGYIKNVVHSLTSKGTCSTIVSMSHVRPGMVDEKVPDGDKNAVYDI